MRAWDEQKAAVRRDTLSHRHRGRRGCLKREDMIKGQKADICGVCLGNSESNMAEDGCQREYLCLQKKAGRNSKPLTVDASGDSNLEG